MSSFNKSKIGNLLNGTLLSTVFLAANVNGSTSVLLEERTDPVDIESITSPQYLVQEQREVFKRQFGNSHEWTPIEKELNAERFRQQAHKDLSFARHLHVIGNDPSVNGSNILWSQEESRKIIDETVSAISLATGLLNNPVLDKMSDAVDIYAEQRLHKYDMEYLEDEKGLNSGINRVIEAFSRLGADQEPLTDQDMIIINTIRSYLQNSESNFDPFLETQSDYYNRTSGSIGVFRGPGSIDATTMIGKFANEIISKHGLPEKLSGKKSMTINELVESSGLSEEQVALILEQLILEQLSLMQNEDRQKQDNIDRIQRRAQETEEWISVVSEIAILTNVSNDTRVQQAITFSSNAAKIYYGVSLISAAYGNPAGYAAVLNGFNSLFSSDAPSKNDIAHKMLQNIQKQLHEIQASINELRTDVKIVDRKIDRVIEALNALGEKQTNRFNQLREEIVGFAIEEENRDYHLAQIQVIRDLREESDRLSVSGLEREILISCINVVSECDLSGHKSFEMGSLLQPRKHFQDLLNLAKSLRRHATEDFKNAPFVVNKSFLDLTEAYLAQTLGSANQNTATNDNNALDLQAVEQRIGMLEEIGRWLNDTYDERSLFRRIKADPIQINKLGELAHPYYLTEYAIPEYANTVRQVPPRFLKQRGHDTSVFKAEVDRLSAASDAMRRAVPMAQRALVENLIVHLLKHSMRIEKFVPEILQSFPVDVESYREQLLFARETDDEIKQNFDETKSSKYLFEIGEAVGVFYLTPQPDIGLDNIVGPYRLRSGPRQANEQHYIRYTNGAKNKYGDIVGHETCFIGTRLINGNKVYLGSNRFEYRWSRSNATIDEINEAAWNQSSCETYYPTLIQGIREVQEYALRRMRSQITLESDATLQVARSHFALDAMIKGGYGKCLTDEAIIPFRAALLYAQKAQSLLNEIREIDPESYYTSENDANARKHAIAVFTEKYAELYDTALAISNLDLSPALPSYYCPYGIGDTSKAYQAIEDVESFLPQP